MAPAMTPRHSSAGDHFNHTVLPRLQSVLRRLRLYILLEGLSWVLAVALLCFLGQLALDYFLHLRVDLRAASLGAAVVIIGVTAWRVARPLRCGLSPADVARVVEQRFPHLQSRLISAVEFTGPRAAEQPFNSPRLIDEMVGETLRLADELPFGQILNHPRARRHALTICGIVAIPVLMTWFAQEAMGTWFERNLLLRDARWRQNTYLTVLNDADRDGIIQAPLGDDLVVRVKAVGQRPRQVEMALRFDNGDQERQSMVAVGEDEFRLTLPRLKHELSFDVRGGDARLEDLRIQLVERPRVVDAAVRVMPPGYTAEAPYQLRAGKSLIEALPGSAVEIRFSVNKPVTRAELVCDHSAAGEAVPDGGEQVVRFQPDRDATCHVELLDEVGLSNVKPRQFVVRMVQDDPPVVTLKVEGAGEILTPQARLQLVLQFKDRYGLADAAVIHALSDDAEPQRLEADQLTPGSRQLSTTLPLHLADLGAREGRQLTLRGEATDLNDVGGPGVGSSAQYTFRIVSPEALLAELARREHEFQQEFERLTALQEQLRNDLLSAAGVHRRDPDAPLNRPMQASERRQRQLSRQAGHVRAQFQSIYDELAANQLDTPQVRIRLLQGIVAPLDELVTRMQVNAADDIARFDAEAGAELFADIDATQQNIIEEMHRILANMAKWEGYHETLALLQAVIEMQEQLQQETDRTLNDRLDEIFGGDRD